MPPIGRKAIRIVFCGGLNGMFFHGLATNPSPRYRLPTLLSVLRRIEARGALETAHRALQNCSQVFRYAVATGRAERDPTGDLRDALPPVKGKHFAAIIEPQKVGTLLRCLDGYRYEGTLVVRCALRLAPLVFVRPGELHTAQWADIDLDAGEWRYRITKTDTQQIVPLSRQAIGILEEIHPLTSRDIYVFPSARSAERPMSDNAILAAMRRMGIRQEEMSAHGLLRQYWLKSTNFKRIKQTEVDDVITQLNNRPRKTLGFDTPANLMHNYLAENDA
jgi:integrase